MNLKIQVRALLISIFAIQTITIRALAQTNSVSITGSNTTINTEAAEKSTIKTSEILGNKKFSETTEVTDAKLKADAGSLSKYSLSFNLSYYGPTIGEIDAKDQPNPDGTPGTYETSLGGSIGARYRLDSNSSISTGTGLKAIHPMHGMERFDLNNPYLTYNKLHRIGEIQMKNSPGISAVTVPNYTKIGEYASLNYDFSSVYNFAATGFAAGLDTSIGYYLYNRAYQTKDGKAARYNIALYPTFKYNFSDKLNINTSTNFSYWNARSRNNQWDLNKRTVSQRLGLGYAFTRDIYISPYLNFYPDRLAADATTLNISTTFNLL